jgi:hypothetical protein
LGITKWVHFWDKYPKNGADIYHDQDREELVRLRSDSNIGLANWAEGMLNPTSEALHVYPCLRATPYVGNLKKASIILAMLNPGVGDYDEDDHKKEKFRNILDTQRRQEGASTCFAVRDPKNVGFNSWTIFYRRFFAATIREFSGVNKTEKVPESNWDLLAQRLAIVQLIPYYSREASFVLRSDYFQELPSVRAARQAMKELLGRNVVIFRWPNQPGRWGVEPDQGICLRHRGIGLSRIAKDEVISELRRRS